MSTEPDAPPPSSLGPPPWRIDGIDASIQGKAVRAAADSNMPLSEWLARAIELATQPRPHARGWPALLAGLVVGLVAGAGALWLRETPPGAVRVERSVAVAPAAVAEAPAPVAAPAPAAAPPAAPSAPAPDPAPAPAETADAAPAPEDPLAAMRAAAEGGDGDAQFALATRYADGVDVAQDWAQAFQWYALAARSGVAAAQHNLGVLYERGLGTAADPAEAFAWYREAAGQGYPPAQYNLAVAYARGAGVAADIGEAIRWFERAATAIPQANFSLGQIFEVGFRVPKDPARARRHYAAAAAAGDERARERLAALTPPDPRTTLREIQALLAKLRYDPGPADGSMGAKTRTAIRSFQQHAGLPVDGEPSPELLETLRNVAGG